VTVRSQAKIIFQGFAPSADIRATAAKQVEALERAYGGLTTCRLVVKAPAARHKIGGLFQVSIQLGLPGRRRVAVGPARKADRRFGKLEFAMNDAFKRARRCLQDQARFQRGQTKARTAQPFGTIASVSAAGGYGFIESPAGDTIYFHKNSVVSGPFARLKAGQPVFYFEEAGEKGMQASSVRAAGRHGLRAALQIKERR
jgi:cold shock CspA family protein